jgi:hypothetical protein
MVALQASSFEKKSSVRASQNAKFWLALFMWILTNNFTVLLGVLSYYLLK